MTSSLGGEGELKAEAEVTLAYDGEEAEAIAKAISPDNVKVPKGLSIKTERMGFEVHTYVKYEGRLMTFLSTLDDLLRCASTAEEAIRFVRSKGAQAP